MIRIKQIVVVEGKYDRHTLSGILDATIIETGGFRIFSDKDTSHMICELAEKRGVIILTDSDRAGFAIRNYLAQLIGKENVTHVYIPDIYGKERRKDKPSKENKLGVEGMSEEIIIKALENAGVFSDITERHTFLTKFDLYQCGLSGKQDSAAKRKKIAKRLCLPENISSNRLLDVMNIMLDKESFEKLINE